MNAVFSYHISLISYHLPLTPTLSPIEIDGGEGAKAEAA